MTYRERGIRRSLKAAKAFRAGPASNRCRTVTRESLSLWWRATSQSGEEGVTAMPLFAKNGLE